MAAGADNQTERIEEVAREIRRLHNEEGYATITSSKLSEHLPYSSKEIGHTLPRLADDGVLTEWGSSTPVTYTIEEI